MLDKNQLPTGGGGGNAGKKDPVMRKAEHKATQDAPSRSAHAPRAASHAQRVAAEAPDAGAIERMHFGPADADLAFVDHALAEVERSMAGMFPPLHAQPAAAQSFFAGDQPEWEEFPPEPW